jgi:hypothetical protein
LLKCARHVPTLGWCPHHLGGACNWPLADSIDMSLCPLLFGVARDSLQWLDCHGGHLDFVPFFLSLMIGNIHHFSLCFLLFNFSPHSINFLFHSFSIYRSFFSFQFSSLIAISHMFGFLFLILGTFVEVFFFFQSNFLLFFFQFDPYYFDIFSFIKAIFQFN